MNTLTPDAMNEFVTGIAPMAAKLAEFEKGSPLFVGDLIDSLVFLARNPGEETGKRVVENLEACKWADPLNWDRVDPNHTEHFGALMLGAVYLRNPEEFKQMMQQHLSIA